MNGKQCKCNKQQPFMLVVHMYNKEDIIEINCNNCHGNIFITSIAEIMQLKNCYCCYCKDEIK